MVVAAPEWRSACRDTSLRTWGRTLRAARATRIYRRRMLIGAAVAVAVILASYAAPLRPLLLWNASASVPTGLYFLTPRTEWRKGDLVAARLPTEARGLAAARNYLPSGTPVLKRVAATSPDHVCARADKLYVNDALIVVRRSADAAGRPLPRWHACRRLRPGELLLLAPALSSFDGRYFGPSHSRDILGLARKW